MRLKMEDKKEELKQDEAQIEYAKLNDELNKVPLQSNTKKFIKERRLGIKC